MSPKKINLIHTVYGIVLSVLLVVVGALCICACVTIYNSGAHPFSPESVNEQFSKIAIPIYLCLAAIAGGMILRIVLPLEEKKLSTSRMLREKLFSSKSSLDFDSCPEKIRNAITKENKTNIFIHIACIIFCIGVCVPALFYLFNIANFPGDNPTSEVGSAMLVIIPCAGAAMSFCVARALLLDASRERQLALIKSAMSQGAKKKASDELSAAANKKQLAVNILRIVLFLVAASFIIGGIFNGGMRDVLGKAINICRECIGLG